MNGLLQTAQLLLEVGTSAALVLGDVAGRFHAVDGKELAPDQALAVAKLQHLGEQRRNLVAQMPDEAGNGGEVRGMIAAERHEYDFGLAGATQPGC